MPAMLWQDFVAAQTATKSFEKYASYYNWIENLTGVGEPTRINRAMVTANLLPTLGALPQLGRLFTQDDDRPDGPPVVILSDHLWRNHFHADPAIVGKSIALNGKLLTIIGVLPRSFSFPDLTLEPDGLKRMGTMFAGKGPNETSGDHVVSADIARAGAVFLIRCQGRFAEQIGSVADIWEREGPQGNVSDIYFIAGISLAVALVFCAVAVFPERVALLSPRILASIESIPLSIGWFASSAGLMAVLSQFVQLLDLHIPSWAYGVGGAASVFVCIPFMRAQETFENRTKSD